MKDAENAPAPGDRPGTTTSPAPAAAKRAGMEPTDSVSRPSSLHDQPPSIPDHTLLDLIGRGSYGEVWLARSAVGTLRAVKVVQRKAFDHDRPYEREFAGIQKFEPVSRSHEGFVDILQIGRDDDAGHFYYVMELADNVQRQRSDGVMESWSDAMRTGTQHSDTPLLYRSNFYTPRTLRHDLDRRGRLPPADCIEIGLALTAALAHLHHQALVHRDVKPSNIIFVGGVPKLADIGLVADMSEARSFVGTDGFIPPEGPGSPQADLYSLGKVLYEISTGKDRQEFPALPSDLRDSADRASLSELNEVIVKACATDLRERYRTSEEMRADLAILQSGKSVRHIHAVERHLATARRISIAALVIALVAGGAFYLQRERTRLAQENLDKSERLRLRAAAAERDATERLRAAYIAQAQANRFSGRTGWRCQNLDLLARAAAIRPGLDARNELIATVAMPDVCVTRETEVGLKNFAAVPSPDFEQYALADDKGDVKLLRMRDDSPVRRLSGAGKWVWELKFSPDGRHLAAKSHDPGDDANAEIRVWDLSGDGGVRQLPRPDCPVTIDFHPRQPALGVGGADQVVSLYDLNTGERTGRWVTGLSVTALRFSPRGDRFAVAEEGNRVVQIHDCGSGKLLLTLPHEQSVYGLDWHPDGQRLAVGCGDGRIRFWDTDTGESVGEFAGHKGEGTAVVFGHRGDRFASASWDDTICIWDLASGSKWASVLNKAMSLQFSRDDRFVAFTRDGSRISLLEVADPIGHYSLRGTSFKGYHGATFSPDGRVLVVTSEEGVSLWNFGQRQEAARFPVDGCNWAFFSRDGDSLFTCGRSGVQRWSLAAATPATERFQVGTPERVEVTGGFSQACLYADGTRLALADEEACLLVELGQRNKVLARLPHSNAGYIGVSPDDRWVVTCGWFSVNAVIWDAETGQRVHSLPTGARTFARFSPDGRWLVTGNLDEYQFWQPGTWTLVRTLPRRQTVASAPIVFSPDGELLALATTGRAIQLISPATGEELASLEVNSFSPLCFSPTSRHLVVADAKAIPHVWDLALVRQQLRTMKLDWEN